MKLAIGLASLGLFVVVVVIFCHRDLKGRPSTQAGTVAFVMGPARSPSRSFTLADCLPGTISPWTLPSSDEHNDEATTAVLSCRSRTSAIALLAAYGVTTSLVLGALLGMRRRTRNGANARRP